MDKAYSPAERIFLWITAVLGLFGVNGAFVYSLFYRPELLEMAESNLVCAAFMTEALLLVPWLAYLLTRWRVIQVHWLWFVALSLLGSILFALPIVLLWSEQRAGRSASRSSFTAS
jgi:hypothetical protein